MHASRRTWRNDFRMATEAKCANPKTPGAPTNPANSGHKLTPEELAELIDSHEYDEAPAAIADCTDYDPK
jgi:hypothetical protein